MKQSKLQITVQTDLKEKFEKKISPLDISNAIRLFMKDVVDGDVNLGIKHKWRGGVPDEMENSITEGLQDLEEGRYTEIGPDKSIREYLNGLSSKDE